MRTDSGLDRVGVRDLKEHASEILRRVREEGEAFEITLRGRVVARLVPTSAPERQRSRKEWLQEGRELSAAISARWPKGITAVESIREDRREL